MSSFVARRGLGLAVSASIAALAFHSFAAPNAPVELPTGQRLEAPAPGQPAATNSFPSAVAVSPDQNTLAWLANGFGTTGSGLQQSIVLLDRATGRLRDFPDPRLAYGASQTAFVGLAFSSKGDELYVSFASTSNPEGTRAGAGREPGDAPATGNGIAVYRVSAEGLTPSRFFPLPLRVLPEGRALAAPLGAAPAGRAPPYPAGLAVIPGKHGDTLLVAANLSDELVVVDATTGAVTHRVDVGDNKWVPSAFPYGVVASRNGTRAWVSLWNGSAVAEVDLKKGKVARHIPVAAPADPTAPGSHPTAMVLSKDGSKLYVALANADAVALIDTGSGKVTKRFSTLLPGQKYGGGLPDALALSPDQRTLYVAEAGADAVAVLDARTGEAAGFIPTEWYPTAVAAVAGDLFIAAGKGKGTGPNSGPPLPGSKRAHPYIASILPGSIARVEVEAALPALDSLTDEAMRNNRLSGTPPTLTTAGPIKHVVYVIKENRTYDQVLGDLGVGDGDPSLTLYGEDVTPNQHALARQFGVLDHFFCSGEVSGDGHVWSMAGTSSDYTERTWQIGYRSDERYYDYEGQVQGAFPIQLGIPDVDSPATGYVWGNAHAHGLSHRNYGEFVTSIWCDDPPVANPVNGTPLTGGAKCSKEFVKPGEPLPDGHGGTRANPWPWPIPIVAANVPTMPELVGNYAAGYADFRMDYPDQLRADQFLDEFAAWSADRAAGKGDTMPAFIVLRFSSDHTSGTQAGKASPRAAVADNDLALGRVVEAVSHSTYWEDTAIFALEDDAQDGADHVDAHRSIAFVASRFSPSRAETPVVDHTFYTTVSLIHTMEALLGLPPMNHHDAWAPVFGPVFAGSGDHPAFTANYSNRDNGLIYTMNTPESKGSRESERMDFAHADAVDTELLNRILWEDVKGDVPMPSPVHDPRVRVVDDDE